MIADPPLTPPAHYCGRFAPTPSGPLHFGSLVAAVGSYLEARTRGGDWLVRIEDLDRLREVPGAADEQLFMLEALGFEWTGPVVRQSQRIGLYADAEARLRGTGLVYPCSCSRAEIAALQRPGSPAGGEELHYPGLCSAGPLHPERSLGLRFRTPPGPAHFFDRIQGSCTFDVARQIGDFLVRRRDGQYAYQLAVVVDDAHQGVSDVVRGADLLDNTPRQTLLQQALSLPAVTYAHLPVAVDGDGRKLSKSLQSHKVTSDNASKILFDVLSFLGQSPPVEMRGEDVADLWSWAQPHWSLTPLSGVLKRTVPLEYALS